MKTSQLENRLMNFAWKWSRIKHINYTDNKNSSKKEEHINIESDSEKDKEPIKYMQNKNACKNCSFLLQCFKLHIYDLFSFVK